MMTLVINKMINGKCVKVSTFYPNPADKTTNQPYRDECAKHLQTLAQDEWDSASLYDSNNWPKGSFIRKNSGLKSSDKYAIYL